VIWNYQPHFFVILRLYNLYSNYICISSILNTRLEKVIAGVIIAGACLVSHLAVEGYLASGRVGMIGFFSSSAEDLGAKLRQTSMY
jgi:hypothetical protein